MTTFQLFSKVGRLNGDAFCAVFRAMPFWSVVRSQSQRERFAAEQLGLRGFETFLPMVQTKRAAAPLFNGYFFVRIVEQWRSINFSFGVLGLVRVGDCPSKMPDAEIDAIRAMIDEHGFVRLPDAPSKPSRHVFKKNERVKIIAGPFQGVAALHSGLSAANREICLLAILGSSQRRVAIPSHQVEPAQ